MKAENERPSVEKLTQAKHSAVILDLNLAPKGAVALLATQGNIENDGQDYVGRIVAITDPRLIGVEYCGDTLSEYKAVIINPGGGPPIHTTIAIDAAVDVNAGDRFDISGGTACGDGRISTDLTPK